ncbi:unnamed protein product [Rotaria sordida]|uniref:Uncharacterized protein n=1 Tax=Rotaria sordida TaxID=392033 RepID=A0A814NET4_9BILA|nr:unnamed protein product [Rotaria sordida]
MELPMPLSTTVNIPSSMTESNFENLQRTNIFCCPRCLIHLSNFFIFVMTLSVFIILPMIEIVIGIVYQSECSMNHYIPIYLIVTGIISIIILIFAMFGWTFVYPLVNNLTLKNIKIVFYDAGMFSKVMLTIAILFLLFALAWFIAGNVWVFSASLNVQYIDPIEFPNTYCNRNVYLFGFWSIIIKYIFTFVICCRLNCYICNSIQNTIDQAQLDINISIN